MNSNAISPLLSEWWSRPDTMRHPCATEMELLTFDAVHGPIPKEFRAFLSTFGGGVVGAEWVDGIQQLFDTHAKFQSEKGAGGWSLSETFVIGWDGGGNPFGIHTTSGAVLVEDHTFGGVHEMAPSFEEFLRTGLAKNEL